MKSLSIFDIMAVLLTLSAIFGYINHRFLRLPHTIGLVVIALAASGAIVLLTLPFQVLVPAMRLGVASKASISTKP